MAKGDNNPNALAMLQSRMNSNPGYRTGEFQSSRMPRMGSAMGNQNRMGIGPSQGFMSKLNYDPNMNSASGGGVMGSRMGSIGPSPGLAQPQGLGQTSPDAGMNDIIRRIVNPRYVS